MGKHRRRHRRAPLSPSSARAMVSNRHERDECDEHAAVRKASRSQKMRRALDGVSQTGDEHAPSLRRDADPRKVKAY
uniref:Uncharacterized protein n=1 Tax=Thermosporothrix sp. COM3 TaxID=2490863 RepID=A0A455SJV7_9CHLR|nr:hypothetical protein KTC_11760 [Thermosporothrix sp. COM3]